ncbi:MAG: hypothetical protein IPL33_11450 [Sphingobacteriales bacterium]|nr:hypothetical protein [Sphingobacteriales bacterium]
MRSLFVYLSAYGFSMRLLLPTALLAQTIGGTTTVCEGECLSYTASGGTAPYTWTVTGGTPTLFVGTNVNICWGTSGSGNITLTDASNATTTATITINPKPTPTIVPPIVPACPAINSGAVPSDNHTNNCQKACANSCALYYVPYTTGSTYVWSASGHVSLTPSGSGNSQATVCWGNVGNGSLKVVETNVFGCQDSTRICINKIPSPTAAFTPGPNITVCQGQTVSFNNTSTGAVSYLWTFGGGSPAASTQTHPTAIVQYRRHLDSDATCSKPMFMQRYCHCYGNGISGQVRLLNVFLLCVRVAMPPSSTPPGCGLLIHGASQAALLRVVRVRPILQ